MAKIIFYEEKINNTIINSIDNTLTGINNAKSNANFSVPDGFSDANMNDLSTNLSNIYNDLQKNRDTIFSKASSIKNIVDNDTVDTKQLETQLIDKRVGIVS